MEMGGWVGGWVMLIVLGRLLVVMAKAAREALKRLTEPELRRIVREELDYYAGSSTRGSMA